MFVGKALRLVNRQKTLAADQLQDQAADGWMCQPSEREGERDKAQCQVASCRAQISRNLACSGPDQDWWQTNRCILAWLRRHRITRSRMIRRGLHAARRTTRLALIPPKAKELVSAVRIGMGRASLGTASTGHLASASRQLMVGGAIFSGNAPIVQP